MKHRTIAIISIAALVGAGTGASVIEALAASASGPFYSQGTTVDLCIGSNDHVYAEAGKDAGILGSCAAGYTQLPVVSDPDGYIIPPPSTGTTTDIVTIVNPGTVTDAPGSIIALPLTGSSSEGHPITSWVATGLPTSLTINATTGVISGTLTDGAGTYVVTVTATDSVGNHGVVSFDWTITA